jgi:Ca2+-binding RTX toxin-like protein
VGDYAHLEFTKISFNGYAGDDKFDIDSNLNIRAILNGGEGDDVLIAGAGTRSPFDNSPRAVPESVVLLGGAGNDVLVGGDGRDLLIGGDGADVIYGNGGDDMVIGGRTFIDDNSKALAGLLGIWNSAESYVDRIENVRFYVESLIPPDLDVSFVYFDGSTDALYGGSGADWFFANDSTKIGDLNRDEIVN